MVIERHVLGLPRPDPEYGAEAVQLERVHGVVQRVLHECEDRMDSLLGFELATIDDVEQAAHDVFKLGRDAVQVLVGEVHERIDE